MKEYKDIMKKLIEMNRAIVTKKKVMMIIMAAALIALPTMAQDWQSTSAMQGGSSYSPQVTAVGAATVNEMATTTDNYSPSNAPGRPRRTPIDGSDQGDGDEGWTPRTDTDGTGLSPIGDALLPLLLMSLAFCGVVYMRRKKGERMRG